MLSDIRISNKNLTSAVNMLKTHFQSNPYKSYDFVFNSSQNKRGVAILVSSSLNLSEISRKTDIEENYLALLMENQLGKRIILVAVYGPNDYNPRFFANLQQSVQELGPYPIIIGGDWNCTLSTDNLNHNIDCLNMQQLPNARHSNLVADMCDNLDLCDPFRILWPNRQDFSYSPRNRALTNKSRIDFFLISRSTIPSLQTCNIGTSLLSRSFDHKPIFLSFVKNCKRSNRCPFISNFIITLPETELVSKLSVAETYITYGNSVQASVACGTVDPQNYIANMWANFRLLCPDPKYLDPNTVTEETITNRNTILDTLTTNLDSIDYPLLAEIELECPNSLFMETLLNNIRNEVTSYQAFFYKTKNAWKKDAIEKLEFEKNKVDIDWSVVSNLEMNLNTIVDTELNAELQNHNTYDILHHEKITPTFLKIAKTGKTDSTLDDITHDNGVPFDSAQDRYDYIISYYENLYKAPPPPHPSIQMVWNQTSPLRTFWDQTYLTIPSFGTPKSPPPRH